MEAVPKQPLDEQAIRRRAAEAGQEHVFRFWDDLPREGRERLLAEFAEVDFEELTRLVADHLTSRREAELPEDLQPTPFIPLPKTDAEREQHCRMQKLGEKTLAAGRVAALTVAGTMYCQRAGLVITRNSLALLFMGLP